jgi:DNA-binding HxlR family transcriptional regulator
MTRQPRPGQAVRGSRTGRPIMAALDLLGRRGALRIVWELREGRRLTFRALVAAAELNPATVNTRLKEMRAAGLVSADAGYGLTPLGHELIAAIAPLSDWAEAWAKNLRRTKEAHRPT